MSGTQSRSLTGWASDLKAALWCWARERPLEAIAWVSSLLKARLVYDRRADNSPPEPTNEPRPRRRQNYIEDPTALIEEHFRLENGRAYLGQIQLWQRRFFRSIFATNGDGVPQYRLLYDERRRGESKTEDIAAAALADLLTGPARHRSYVVAGDQDQASLVIDSIAGFKSRSPVLSDVTIERSLVRGPSGSELHILSSDAATAYGKGRSKVLFDELSLQPDDRLYKAMWTAVGKRPTAQMVCVSMAGYDFSSIGWKIREQARTTPDYFFASREGSDLAPWLSAKDYEEQRRTLHPADFARFWECRWMEASGSWISREMWDSAEHGRESQTGDARFRYVGFCDVGLVHDPTTIAIAHAEGERSDARVVLDALVTFQGSRSDPVELEAVEDAVEDLVDRFGVRTFTFEAPQSVASTQRLQKRLAGRCQVDARYPTALTQAELFGTLYQLLSNHRLTVFPHEQLRKEALSLVTRVLGGRMKVVDSGAIHQDHVVALGGAARLALSILAKAAPIVAGRTLIQGYGHRRPSSFGGGHRRPWVTEGGNAPLDTTPRGRYG